MSTLTNPPTQPTQSTQSAQPIQSAQPARRTRRTRLLAVLGATAATLAVWAVADPVAGVDLAARPGGGAAQAIGPAAVGTATLLAGLAGWALLALLDRTTRRPRTSWTGVAVAVLVLSLLVGPLDGVGTAARLTLVVLHLTAGAVLIPALRRTAKS